ncbi:hypothetical protein CSUI_006212, partial [Cystoisospora suis]
LRRAGEEAKALTRQGGLTGQCVRYKLVCPSPPCL